MGKEEINKRVTAIVPAYNEAKRIKRVLDVLTTYPKFEEIIVVDDGSDDNTEKIVGNYDVRYVRNPINKGKGYSMDLGVKLAKGDILFFADADVSGLTHQIIDEITEPVLNDEVEMFVGMRERKIYFLNFIMLFVPLLGGERALTKELWEKLPDYYKHYFRVETGLNFYAKYYGRGFKYKTFAGMTQTIKEKKYGFFKGVKQRWRMILNLLSAQLKLQFVDIPKSIRSKRMAIGTYLQSLIGVLVGILLILSAYVGPQKFLYMIFEEKLQEDPSTPLVNFLLDLVRLTSRDTVITVGTTIFIINLLIFMIIVKKYNNLLFESLPDSKIIKNLKDFLGRIQNKWKGERKA